MSVVFLWGLPFTNCYSLLVLLNLSTASSPCEISNSLWRREMSAVFSGGSSGGARGARGPPYFQTKLRHEGPINFFGDRPCLSKGLDDRTSPPPLSQGFDPALVFSGYHPNIWPFLIFLYRITPHQLLEYKCHVFLTVYPFNIHLPSITPSVKTTYLTILWLWFV